MKSSNLETDRELLELAAKAAGDDIKWDSVEACWYRETDDYLGNPEWTPLTDDGDALRLAAHLGLTIVQDKGMQLCIVYWTDNQRTQRTHALYYGDPVGATRIAIVRAAAEIGKKLV